MHSTLLVNGSSGKLEMEHTSLLGKILELVAMESISFLSPSYEMLIKGDSFIYNKSIKNIFNLDALVG
jgi:hypothetical protein